MLMMESKEKGDRPGGVWECLSPECVEVIVDMLCKDKGKGTWEG